MTPTERAHVWQQHITDWQASDAPGSAYCKQQPLVYHQFVYWPRLKTYWNTFKSTRYQRPFSCCIAVGCIRSSAGTDGQKR